MRVGTWKIDRALADKQIRTVPKVSAVSEATESKIPDQDEVYCTKEDLINCSGLALGSPTRFGSMAAPMKYFLDTTGDLWAANALEDIPGFAFTSTSSMHGGQETTLYNLITFMLHHGMLIHGTPYSIKELGETQSGGTPYGPSHVESVNNSNTLTPEEYLIAKETGARISSLIKVFNA